MINMDINMLEDSELLLMSPWSAAEFLLSILEEQHCVENLNKGSAGEESLSKENSALWDQGT